MMRSATRQAPGRGRSALGPIRDANAGRKRYTVEQIIRKLREAARADT